MIKIKKLFSVIPIPMAAVALACSSLGNLLNPYSWILKAICGITSLFLITLVLLKFIFCFDKVKKEFQNPIILSVSASIFMTIMMLATYLDLLPNMENIAKIIWFIAFILHILLILFFTYKLMFKLDLSHVYPTCFVTYVGIVVAAITSPKFDALLLGQIVFWVGFLLYIIIFILVTIRYFKHEIEEHAKPLLCIYAAPMSMSLVGYLTVIPFPNTNLVLVMQLLAQILYVFVLFNLPRLLRLSFYPSYAAFTFPFVITPFALTQFKSYIVNNFNVEIVGIVELIINVETSIAILIVLYVIIEYMKFLKKEIKIIFN